MQKIKPEVTTDQLAQKYPVYLTIDRGAFQLRLWNDLKLVKTYTIAVGMQGLETPAGTYTIDDKQVNPSWHVPDSPWAGSLAGQVIPPGPEDPLKARWMGFYNGAGIHGTDEVSSLGTAASHGCIRMSIPDVIALYDQVPLGTPIYIGNCPAPGAVTRPRRTGRRLRVGQQWPNLPRDSPTDGTPEPAVSAARSPWEAAHPRHWEATLARRELERRGSSRHTLRAYGG